ncbi:MAG: hypothetical protein Q9226_001925 [Calogaya cf. arnoldii]
MPYWIHNGSDHLDAISDYRTILGVCITLPIIMTIVVGMRAYTRIKLLESIGIDDWIIFFSAVGSLSEPLPCLRLITPTSYVPLSMPAYASDSQDGVLPAPECKHQPVFSGTLLLNVSQRGRGLIRPQINFAGRPIYMFGILGFKVALCWAYLRILKASPNPRYKVLIFTVMGGAIVGHVAGTFVLIFQCSPPQKSWHPKTLGKCLDNDATFYGLAAVTIFFDVVIFFLPIPLLMKLNINNKKKIALICVFLLGLLTTVCSIMRMVQIITIANTGNSTMLVLWGVIELNVGIILTCIPTLGPLFPSLTGGTSRTTPSSHNNPSSYQLSALRAHKGTPLASGNTKSQPNGSNGSSSQEEILGLKASEAALYGIGMGMRDDDILKTTEVRVSIDDPERATTSRMQTARAW